MHLGQEVHYYMVYIAYFTELNSKIWEYAQKRRICRENCKYALDERFHGHFCPRRKPAKSCHPVYVYDERVLRQHFNLIWILKGLLGKTKNKDATISDWQPPPARTATMATSRPIGLDTRDCLSLAQVDQAFRASSSVITLFITDSSLLLGPNNWGTCLGGYTPGTEA